MRKALNPGGIICTQAECQWLHLDFIAKVYTCVAWCPFIRFWDGALFPCKRPISALRMLRNKRNCCALFPTVEYAYTAIPTYPSGQIGFMLLSTTDGGGTSVRRMHTYTRTKLTPTPPHNNTNTKH